MFTEDVASIITNAKVMTIISGAGLSKASGIPTFRDTDGLWNKFNPDDFSAGADIFKLVDFYKDRLIEMRDCEPNPGHIACAKLEQLKSVTHITQNVDGLLQKAGCKNVIEVHGTIYNWTCTECEHKFTLSEFECPACSSNKIRPDVILFGEYLDDAKIFKSREAVKHCDVLLLVGTSGVVQPVSLWPSVANRRHIPVIAIAPEKPECHVDIWLQGKSEEILPAIIADLESQIK